CLADFQIRKRPDKGRSADWEVGDTAGLETCVTSSYLRPPALSLFLRSTRAPAEAAGAAVLLADRPIDEERFANDVLLREIAPGAGVGAVHGIVAHDHVVVRSDRHFARLIRKERG